MGKGCSMLILEMMDDVITVYIEVIENEKENDKLENT